jgi:hypothetical protein
MQGDSVSVELSEPESDDGANATDGEEGASDDGTDGGANDGEGSDSDDSQTSVGAPETLTGQPVGAASPTQAIERPEGSPGGTDSGFDEFMTRTLTPEAGPTTRYRLPGQ